MTFNETYYLLQKHGVTLHLLNGELIASPRNSITTELRAGLKVNKPKYICLQQVLTAADEQGFDGRVFCEAYEPETALYAGWFWTNVHKLPWTSDELHSSIKIENPEHYYWKLKSTIEACPEGLDLDALHTNLKALFDLYALPQSVHSLSSSNLKAQKAQYNTDLAFAI